MNSVIDRSVNLSSVFSGPKIQTPYTRQREATQVSNGPSMPTSPYNEELSFEFNQSHISKM